MELVTDRVVVFIGWITKCRFDGRLGFSMIGFGLRPGGGRDSTAFKVGRPKYLRRFSWSSLLISNPSLKGINAYA
jgi:hypothetical protein